MGVVIFLTILAKSALLELKLKVTGYSSENKLDDMIKLVFSEVFLGLDDIRFFRLLCEEPEEGGLPARTGNNKPVGDDGGIFKYGNGVVCPLTEKLEDLGVYDCCLSIAIIG